MTKHSLLVSSIEFSHMYNTFGLEAAIGVTSFDAGLKIKPLEERHLEDKESFAIELMEALKIRRECYRYWVALVRYQTARDLDEALRTPENAFVDSLQHYFDLDAADRIDLTLAAEVRLESDE